MCYVIAYSCSNRRSCCELESGSAVFIFARCLSDESRFFSRHSLTRDGILVARQALYQGV